ncbi:MAG: DUF3179 domain-containing protein [bacterium]
MHHATVPWIGISFVGLILLAADASVPDPWEGDPPGDAELPLAETGYVLGDDLETYADFMMSGGPPPDGIPSIDEPRFIDAEEADLDPGDMVIGFHHEGEAKAYPQNIMVHHEIVNDQVGGLNVAVTYCPLTATAQGFERGSTTLGVSGQLLNSNLVMYDRESESYFSQIIATGLTGQHRGRALVEVNVIWTTWERWVEAHPETQVLSDRTGHLRNYSRDPYGRYNPLGGYYAQDRTFFPLLHQSDRRHAKEMVVGGRTQERAAHFVLEELAEEGVQQTERFLAVYDPVYHTGYIYALDGDRPDVVLEGDGRYRMDGDVYRAGELPLPAVIPVEAFFFAWHAFYPESESPTGETAQDG